jgi:glucose/arabinose dehydrogenase
MRHYRLLTVAALSATLSACGGGDTPPAQYGAAPELPAPERGIMPDMVIASPAEWGDKVPTVPEGYTVTAIAKDLKIPRQTLVLPNGDILVAEGRGGSAPDLKPKDVIAGYIKAKGTSPVKGGNRLTLLRDADGDGTYELSTVFAGIALVFAIVDLFRAHRRGRGIGLYFLILLATWVVGFFDALMHARDAWGSMPGGLILSVIVTLLACVATWLGFCTPRIGGTK